MLLSRPRPHHFVLPLSTQCCTLFKGVVHITIQIKMAAINWVCANCAQHFSRRYSANRHDRNLHEGNGIIVSILDYVVGRIGGQFQSNDPLKSRRNKQNNLLFGSKTINNNLGTKVITDSTSGGVSEVSDNNTNQERAPHNPDLLSQPKRESKVNNRASSADPSQEIVQGKSKPQQYSGLLKKYFHPQDGDSIFALSSYLVSQGENHFLLRKIDNRASNSRNSFDNSATNKQNPGMSHTQISDFSVMQTWPNEKHDEQGSCDVYNQARDNLSEIEQVLSPHYPREIVQNIIKELIKTCNITGKYDILAEALKRHRNNVKRFYI